MALTFPRPFPGGVAREAFELDRADFSSRTTGGRTGGVTAGWPLWKGRWTLSASTAFEVSEAWRATLRALRGQQRTLFAGDAARPWPLLAPEGFAGMTRPGGAAFDGSALGWSVNGTRDVVTLTGLPVGLILSANDYVMWRWTTEGAARRALCSFIEGGVVNGAGSVALTVEPPLPTLVPGAAVADLARPQCVMRLDGDDQPRERGRMGKLEGVVTAIQVLEP